MQHIRSTQGRWQTHFRFGLSLIPKKERRLRSQTHFSPEIFFALETSGERPAPATHPRTNTSAASCEFPERSTTHTARDYATFNQHSAGACTANGAATQTFSDGPINIIAEHVCGSSAGLSDLPRTPNAATDAACIRQPRRSQNFD